MAESDQLRVLVIEDEALVAMLIEDMLADLGHRVVATAGRLDQGLAAADQDGFDIALLDVNLAGQNSYPIAEKLRARRVPIVFATGYGAAGLQPEWRDTPTLQKPFQTFELAYALRTALKA